jgi:hypothetical protein
LKPLADVVGAQAGADGALFDDLHRRGQRAGAQQQRGVVGLRTVVMRPVICTRRRRFRCGSPARSHLALALLEQQDGHALADVLARDVA